MRKARSESQSIFGPVLIRVYGLVHVAQGLAILVVGDRAPGWTLKFAFWGAYRHSRHADNERDHEQQLTDDDYEPNDEFIANLDDSHVSSNALGSIEAGGDR